MTKIFKAIEFDQGTINQDITSGRTNPKDLEQQVGTLIDELRKQGRDANKGPSTPRGYPEGILVSGKDENDIHEGYRRAVKGTPFSDYTKPEGKIYQ